MGLFNWKSKEDPVRDFEEEVRLDIIRRAQIRTEATRMALEIVKKKNGARIPSKYIATGDALKTLEKILDNVSKHDNIKIAAITELYLALESGDTRNLIEFLKSDDNA